MEVISWLEEWFKSNCDGEWEHGDRIKIYNTDNPGWTVLIDLKETMFVDRFDQDWKLTQVSEDDWFGASIKNNIFKASGDPTKLNYLLYLFKNLVESTTDLA